MIPPINNSARTAPQPTSEPKPKPKPTVLPLNQEIANSSSKSSIPTSKSNIFTETLQKNVASTSSIPVSTDTPLGLDWDLPYRFTQADKMDGLMQEHGPSTNTPSPIHSEEEKRLARQITSSVAPIYLRKKMFQNIETKMLSKGTIWASLEKTGCKNISELSQHNIRGLRAKVQKLTPDERVFLDIFLKTPFYATHATDAKKDDIIVSQPSLFHLKSKSLLRRKEKEAIKAKARGEDVKEIKYNKNNTQLYDLAKLSNHDFVFFSLEAGEALKKKNSRFGKDLYRVNFDNNSFRDAGWMMLTDSVHPGYSNAKKHIPEVSAEEDSSMQRKIFDFTDIVFSGKDMKIGLALSIVVAMRSYFSETTKASLLKKTDEDSINKLVNGIFRPQVMAARQFYEKEFSSHDIK